ncbi:hypothetical protein M0R45_019471 [Rubus argutus]|uniref:Uncharacterized protein n=1 Tax=Rubus argutus TaxID=59490 RepID=A0AAW1X5Y7_RUBAR
MTDSSSCAAAPSQEGPPSPRASCRTPTIISRGAAARSSGRALPGGRRCPEGRSEWTEMQRSTLEDASVNVY